MSRYRGYVTLLGPVIGLFILSQTVLAAPLALSMDECVALALKNNYDMLYAKSSREKYYWAVNEAKSNKGVAVTYTHTDEHYDAPPSSSSKYSSGKSDYFENQFSLSLPIYSGGKLENQIKQAQMDLKVADLNISATQQQLRQTVVTDYLTVLQYRNEIEVDQDTVTNYQEHVDLVQKKFDLGMVAKTDVLSSQVDLAGAQDTLIKAQNNYNNAVAALNNAIGLPHDTELTLIDKLNYEKYPLTLKECLQQAEINRPEIAQYRAKVASAKYGVSIAKSGYAPTVDLTASQDWYDSHFAGTQNSNWLVQLTTSLNIFDSGLTHAKIKAAQHNVDMVVDQSLQERDTILLAVRQYHLGMFEAEKRIVTSKVSVVYAEENLRIQKLRYEVEVGTNLDLRDAILSLATARNTYIQALYDFHTNRAKLETAIGLSVK